MNWVKNDVAFLKSQKFMFCLQITLTITIWDGIFFKQVLNLRLRSKQPVGCLKSKPGNLLVIKLEFSLGKKKIKKGIDILAKRSAQIFIVFRAYFAVSVLF